jgi:hypothetical protein
MSVASFEVIQESISVLWATYTTGELPRLELGLTMYIVLGSATLLKCLCWAVCAALQSRSDSMLALAEVRMQGSREWGAKGVDGSVTYAAPAHLPGGVSSVAEQVGQHARAYRGGQGFMA